MPSKTRGRNMVELVLEEKKSTNQPLDTPLSLISQNEPKKDIVTEIETPCNIHNFGGLWAHKFSYDKYSHILTPEVEYASTLNFTKTSLQKQLDLLHKEFDFHEKEDSECLNLLCDETLPSSVMNESLINIITIELEEMCQGGDDEIMDKTKDGTEENMDKAKDHSEESTNDTNKGSVGGNDDNNNEKNNANCENKDEEKKKNENYMDEAENGSEKIMDETKDGTEENMDKAKDHSEESTNDTNKGPVDNLDQNKNTDNINKETIQELEENHVDLETNENTDNTCEAPKGKTKSGKPRLRRKYEESLDARNENKKKMKLERMSVKPGCESTCIEKCSSLFTESERQDINKSYWELGYEAQGIYVKSLITDKEVNRRIRESTQMRKHTYSYFLKTENKKNEVCKIFFLTTLGYDKKNDRRVFDILKKPLNAQSDRRSKEDHPKKVNRDMLKEHIESFRPAIAHYRRIHAPNRRYLPSDITVSAMHKDFILINPTVKVSYDLYRKFLKKDMNISFAQLGNEECEE